MKVFNLVAITIVMLVSSSCAIYHHYGPYTGRIVDEETQQPLEGVVVLADYVTWMYLSPGGPTPYFLDTQEVTTDKSGEFKIPSLNAFAFRPLSTFTMLGSPYGPFSPYFTIFKPQYKCVGGVNVPTGDYWEISLKKLKARQERIENHCFPVSVPKKKMIKFIESLNVESVDLGLQPVPID